MIRSGRSRIVVFSIREKVLTCDGAADCAGDGRNQRFRGSRSHLADWLHLPAQLGCP